MGSAPAARRRQHVPDDCLWAGTSAGGARRRQVGGAANGAAGIWRRARAPPAPRSTDRRRPRFDNRPMSAASSSRALRAMILAAGRGERMRPLTDRCPKPLLPVRGKPLIEWHLEALARGGVREVVVNTAWLEERLVEALGDGSRFGLAIRWSLEGRDHGGALETAGGIAKALPLLAQSPDDIFWLVSGDIHAPDFRFDATATRLRDGLSAHLWLVDNPPYHAQGDFGLGEGGLASADAGSDRKRWTYANIALVRARLCEHIVPGTRAALGPLLYAAAREGRISAEIYEGRWANVGTPGQLAALG